MNKIKYWLPAIFIMCIIFLASHDISSGQKSGFVTKTLWIFITYLTAHIPDENELLLTGMILRKIAHVSEYFLLTLSYFYGFYKTTKFSIRKISIFSVLIAILYSMSDEFHQTFIPSRTGTYKDLIIDSIGMFIGYIFANLIVKTKK